MTSDFDCHVYLIDGGSELALVDTGSGLAIDAVLSRLANAGYRIDRLRHIFLTHKHADHSGGAAALQSAAAVTVHASAHTAEAVADETGFNERLARARRVGTYPPDYRFHAARVDSMLDDGARVTFGDVTLQAVRSDGHCAGHLCYLMVHQGRRHLFTGDAILSDGLVLLQAIPDCSLPETIQTVERLAALEVDVLLPGHFMPRLDRGREDIARCADRIRAGLAPISAI